MTSFTHATAPTQYVETNGIRFAYRRFGKSGGVPLVFNIHFTGTMDHWDPAVTDGFARDREVMLFNNAGDTDVIIYSINSWILQQKIPNAQLILYPDANHGSLYQYPKRFVTQVAQFLDENREHA